MASTYGYCTYAEILAETGTTLSSTTVDAIISRAERKTRAYLASKGCTPVANDDTLKEAVILLTNAYLVKRMALDGSRPNQISLGDMSMSSNTDREYDALQAEWKEMCDIYVSEKNGDGWEDSSVDAYKTIIRQDHIMPAMKLDQAHVPGYHDRADEYSLEDGEEVTD